MKVNVHEAKTHFSKLLMQTAQGQEIIIAKAGRPVARLVPVKPRGKNRVPGSARGKIVVAKDFDAPLPKSILRTFQK